MHEPRARTVAVTVGIVVLACACCCGLWRTYNELGQMGVERAARRVGVEPTLDGIATYIRASIEVGMSREEVEEALSAVAPLKVIRGTLDGGSSAGWGPIACDHVWLEFTPLPGHSSMISACYDNKGKLVKLDFVGSDVPSLEISAPHRNQIRP